MKKKKIIIPAVICACVTAGIVFVVVHKSGSEDEGAVYVQKVSDLLPGTSASFSQRLSGVAESQDSVDIKADSSKKIVEIYVNQGDSVEKDAPLFVYDVSDAQTNIQSTQLDIEGLNNDIQACNDNIAELTQEKNNASGEDALSYTTQIQDKQMQIRQDQLDIQSKQNSLQKYQQEIDQATVKAPIAGIVKSVNANGGTDPNSGQELPTVSISETSAVRIKGTVNEQNISQVSSGMAVTVLSRVDETKTWNGTVTSVETDPQTNSDNSDYSSSDSNGESASKYTFYVSLENSDGLMLGQHVYIEPGTNENGKTGIWLDSSFVTVEDDGNSYVWAAENDKLVKKQVEIGETDDSDYTVQITSGLTKDDEIAYPDSSYTEGMKVSRMESEQ